MKKIAISAGIGVAAALLLAVVYFGARHAGLQIEPPLLVAAAAGLAFASSIAAFTLVAMNRPIAGKIRTYPLLTEENAQNFIAKFREQHSVQIVARPGMTADIALIRFRDMLNNPDRYAEKNITVTLRAAKRELFNPVILEDLFEKLKPLKGFYHVLLMSEANEFVGYIPAESALKEFTGKNAESKISEYIIDVFDDPALSKRLRAIQGASRDDTVSETDDARDAAKKMWLDDDPTKLRKRDEVSGLVVSRHLKPYGFLDKLSVIKLTATAD